MTKVVKRDGREVEWDSRLIFNAVNKAAKAAGMLDQDAHSCAEVTRSKVVSHIKKEKVSVDEIQDMVEKSLMGSKWKNVAKEYIQFRHDRDMVREDSSDLYKSLSGFLSGTDETYARENANKSATELNTHRDLIAGIVSKHSAKKILPKEVVDSVEKGEIHVHDADYILSKGITNCGVYDFANMLKYGVTLGDVDIEQPKNVQTAANVMCQILCKISGLTYGGQSVHEFDKVLQPYALKTKHKLEEEQKKWGLPDKWLNGKLRKVIYDACQTFLYQSSTCTSPNGQSSFCSISLSLSTDPICKIIKEEYLKCHMDGLGKDHKTPIFPKVLYFVENGTNLQDNDPNHEEFNLALKCSTKRMYPDYISAVNNRKMTGGSQNVISPMGKLMLPM